MTDLIIDFRGMERFAGACLEAPPSTGTDPCSYSLPLRDSAEAGAASRSVRFDRRGDSFVLSPANSGDVLTWAGSHGNLSTVLTTMRVLQNLSQTTRLGSTDGGAMTLAVVAHYITTGEGFDPSLSGEEGERVIVSALLDILTDSPEDALSSLLGRLSVLRSQDWLNAESRERVRSIIEMVDLVPAYRTFRQNFVEESEFAHWSELSRERMGQVSAIAEFARDVVLDNAFDRPLRYSDGFRAAEAAYTSLHQADILAGRRPDFCGALETALSQLRGDRGLPQNFLNDCRLASRLVDRPPTEAVRETLRSDVFSSSGLQALQRTVESESSAANMSIDWLTEQGDDPTGGRIGEILSPLLAQLNYVEGREGGEPRLTLNVVQVIMALNHMIDGESTRRREYILSTLALVRRFFPASGEFPPVRAFVAGEFRDLEWDISEEDRELLSQFLRRTEARIERSQNSSDLALPILEGALCAIGAAGALTAHLVPEIGGDRDLQLGIGTASVGLAGAGCSALAGHFLWPELSNDVHNRYLWEGLTGLGGAIVAGGLYFLISFFTRGEGSNPGGGIRFPVDVFGP